MQEEKTQVEENHREMQCKVQNMETINQEM